MEHFEPISKFLLSIRGFNPEEYIQAKVKAINTFFKDNKLDSCVIGISGGVDSAVVYKLLVLASKEPSSPLKKVYPLLMPIRTSGTTGQDEATRLGIEVIKEDVNTPAEFIRDLTAACANLVSELTLRNTNDTVPSPWTIGQIASIVRTPMIYGQAAFLQQLGYKSIVVGTTNLSECGYVGFYGKASDFSMDLQPISDIYKSEVYKIAQLLNVPLSIINRHPTGDVYDNSTDEETIGAPYWFLELYTLFLHFKNNTLEKLKNNFPVEEKTLWNKYVQNIEDLRHKNLHKYGVGNSAYHINIMPQLIFMEKFQT